MHWNDLGSRDVAQPQTSCRIKKQDAQLSQRDSAAGCVIVLAKSRMTGTGRQYITDIIGLSSTTVTIEFSEKNAQ